MSDCQILLTPLSGPEDPGSIQFSVSCTITPGGFLTDQTFCPREADFMFHLHIWPLLGDPCRRNVFLRGLQPSLPLQGENPLERSMKLIGNSSLSVFEEKLIPLISLLDE